MEIGKAEAQKPTGQDHRITVGRLRSQYGFSDKWLRLLGPPDAEVRNPHFRKAAPMKLYCESRVLDFIAGNAEFREWLNKRARRQAGARAGARTKAAEEERRRQARVGEAMEWARIVAISMEPFPADVRRAAQSHFDRRGCDDVSFEVNDRGILAFLRHGYTSYDGLLCELSERFGGKRTWMDFEGLSPAAAIIRERVNQQVCQRIGLPYGGGQADDGRPW
jgi:hypothetical protein